MFRLNIESEYCVDLLFHLTEAEGRTPIVVRLTKALSLSGSLHQV